jgi:hypothetical protein
MGKAGSVAAGLMMVWMLVGCGGTVEETTEPIATEVEAQYACPVGGNCPTGTECVDGLCRNCTRYPQFCARTQATAPSTQAAAIVRPQRTSLPYCWNLNGTPCSYQGPNMFCTDGTYSDYECTCGADWLWRCPEVR